MERLTKEEHIDWISLSFFVDIFGECQVRNRFSAKRSFSSSSLVTRTSAHTSIGKVFETGKQKKENSKFRGEKREKSISFSFWRNFLAEGH